MSSSELQMPQAKQGAKLIIQSQKHKHTIGQLSVIADKVAIEIDWRELLKVSRKHPSYQALVKTAIIKEDLTFTLTEQTRVGDLINAMQAQDQRVKNIELKDQYQQNFTFTLSFQDPQNNLSGEEMVSLRQNIVQVAKEQFNAQLVGQI
jgi:phenylalanyl-tRNA synthetase beta subunit